MFHYAVLVRPLIINHSGAKRRRKVECAAEIRLLESITTVLRTPTELSVLWLPLLTATIP